MAKIVKARHIAFLVLWVLGAGLRLWLFVIFGYNYYYSDIVYAVGQYILPSVFLLVAYLVDRKGHAKAACGLIAVCWLLPILTDYLVYGKYHEFYPFRFINYLFEVPACVVSILLLLTRGKKTSARWALFGVLCLSIIGNLLLLTIRVDYNIMGYIIVRLIEKLPEVAICMWLWPGLPDNMTGKSESGYSYLDAYKQKRREGN